MNSLTLNAQRLLRALVTSGPSHRADLARTIEVSRATITNLTNRLVAEGWIEELDHTPGLLKNPLGTTAQLGVLASVMFVVDSCTVTLARFDGRLLKESTLCTGDAATAAERLTLGADLSASLLADAGLPPAALRAVHLAVDTQMDAVTGEIPAQRASSRWYGVNPKRYFADRFGVPVHTQNTARLEGLAEQLWGTGREHPDMLYVEVSHGVTSGHVTAGVIQSGSRGGSGELGHTVYDWNGPLCTCGNSGCLMQYVSIPALLRDYSTAAGTPIDWEGFCTLVTDRDATAVAITERAAMILGRMLVNVCHLLDPEAVVLSGEVARGLPSFVDDVSATFHERALPLLARSLPVLRAELEDLGTSTARAGIESLRGDEALILAATRAP